MTCAFILILKSPSVIFFTFTFNQLLDLLSFQSPEINEKSKYSKEVQVVERDTLPQPILALTVSVPKTFWEF